MSSLHRLILGIVAVLALCATIIVAAIVLDDGNPRPVPLPGYEECPRGPGNCD